MPTEQDTAIATYVRHRIIGIDTTEVLPLAKKIGVSKAWVTNIRKGRQPTVGKEAMGKLANVYFGGSIDRLQQTAVKFVADNPHLLVKESAAKESAQTDGVIFRLWIDGHLVVTLADANGQASRGKMHDFSDSMRNAVIASVHMLGYSFEQVTWAAREVLDELRAKGHAPEDYEPPTMVEMLRRKLNGKPNSGTYPSSGSLKILGAESSPIDAPMKPTKAARRAPAPSPARRDSENK